MKALIIVDMQNDFVIPSGSLYIKDAQKMITQINNLIQKFNTNNDLVIATKDFHPKKHISFASTHNKELFSSILINGFNQIMWPDHCVQGSDGADIVNDIDIKNINYIVKKGYKINNESYSGFADQNGEVTKLHEILQNYQIKDLTIIGVAFDYCVLYTIKDALKLNYNVSTYLDLVRSVNSDKTPEIINYLKKRKIVFKEVINYD